jgi:hypothetical protein
LWHDRRRFSAERRKRRGEGKPDTFNFSGIDAIRDGAADAQVRAPGRPYRELRNWFVDGKRDWGPPHKAGSAGSTAITKWKRRTQSIFTDTDTISRFQAELISEHMTAQ